MISTISCEAQQATITVRNPLAFTPASNTIRANISLSPGWNQVPGIHVADRTIEITPSEYFFRYEEPAWHIIDWDFVRAHWDDLNESSDAALEQNCLEFIKQHARLTTNPAEVLENAEKVYSYLFDTAHIHEDDLGYVTPKHLQILRETSTIMALNRVARDGKARNVGPAWFFPVCAQVVFDLTNEESAQIDELYHGGFFNESRRVDGIKAHTALGGRLVHGCSGKPMMKGGAVVAYGTNVVGFSSDLASFANDWMDLIRTWRLR